jgi:hypothetical protein
MVERDAFPIPSNNLQLIASVIPDDWIQLGDSPSPKIPTHRETSSPPDATFRDLGHLRWLPSLASLHPSVMVTDVTMTTASLYLPIPHAEEPEASLVAGLHTSVPGVRSRLVQIRLVSKTDLKGKGKGTKRQIE